MSEGGGKGGGREGLRDWKSEGRREMEMVYVEAHACETKGGHEIRAGLTLLVLGAATSSMVEYSASGPWSQEEE